MLNEFVLVLQIVQENTDHNNLNGDGTTYKLHGN